MFLMGEPKLQLLMIFTEPLFENVFFNYDCSNCWLLRWKSRAGDSVLIRKLEGMKPQPRCSYSSQSASRVAITKQDQKSNENSVDSIIKDDAASISSEIEQVRRDPVKLQSMTVRELRQINRSVGISTRGTKKDLVSALLSSSVDEINNGKISSSSTMQNVPSKRKEVSTAIEETVECATMISKPTNKQKRSRSKEKLVQSTVTEANTTTEVSQLELYESQEIFVGPGEPWTILSHKKPKPEWIAYNPRCMRPPPLCRDSDKFMKLLSWNVNGLRALVKSKGFSAIQLAQREDFDVLCLQETKIQDRDVEGLKELVEGYSNSFWTCSVSKLGYSGTAIISRIKPISISYGLGVPDHDSEGRLVTVEFDNFYLLCSYVPNSGDGLRRLNYRVTEWDPCLSNYMKIIAGSRDSLVISEKELEKSKPVILTGDLNCAYEEIDIFNPAGNKRSAGFTIEERESFEKCYLSRGFVDTFRRQHPNVVGYTYWGYRHRGRKTNKGWRLDYFLVSESIADKAYDSYILPDIGGSDHSPIGLVFKL